MTFYNQQREKWGDWWHGNFKNWEEANRECIGYDQHIIVEQTLQAISSTLNDPNRYERDGCIIHGQPTYTNNLINLLNSMNDNLKIIDFGGSLGSTYFQIRNYLYHTAIDWNVVEQDIFVETGKQCIKADELSFHTSIDNIQCNNIQLILFSSSLPYIEKPYEILQKAIDYKIKYIFIDRHSVILNGDEDILTIQIVPPCIYETIYPCWFFGEKKMHAFMLNNGYKLNKEFMALGDTSSTGPYVNNSAYKGYIYQI